MKSHLAELFTAWVILAASPAIAATRYVDLNSPSPTAPFTSWATAATNIQDAVDACNAGDVVLVTNGVYSTGGRMWFDSGTNRVTVTNAITVRSVNGPVATVIQGRQAAGTNAARCVYLGGNSVLAGFTLTNGQSGVGNYPAGGGVYCSDFSQPVTVSNCVIVGNIANTSGGGAYRGILVNCVLSGNTATTSGGGAASSTLINCTVVSNSAASGGGVWGNGNWTNCILYHNTATTRANYDIPNVTGPVSHCCTTPVPGLGRGASGNLTNEPALGNLSAGDYRLASNSPCINAGGSPPLLTGSDLAGAARVVSGTIDIGAYEFQFPTSMLSYGWLLQNGLPTDGSADFADTDGDGHNNWQEWRADTVPTNAASVFRLVAPLPVSSGISLSWPGAASRRYWVERLSHFGGALPFQTIATNIAGTNGVISFTDFTATNIGPYFYRVGVEP